MESLIGPLFSRDLIFVRAIPHHPRRRRAYVAPNLKSPLVAHVEQIVAHSADTHSDMLVDATEMRLFRMEVATILLER